MRPLTTSFSILAALTIALPAAQAQETATTDPVGFVTVKIAGSFNGSKTTSFISIPLLDSAAITGQVSGVISGVTSNTISNSSAGWSPGELSRPESPFLIQITSGQANGRMFLISSSSEVAGSQGSTANTSTSATIVGPGGAAETDLTTLGIAVGTDTYRIYPCDTIKSFFGTPNETGVLGGANGKSADNIVIFSNGTPATYFYSTEQNAWIDNTRNAKPGDNVALLPYYGLLYARQSENPLDLVVTGTVPVTPRSVAIAGKGNATLLAQYWPINSTLVDLGLQNMPGWQSSSNFREADRVVIKDNIGAFRTYFYNGVNWTQNTRGATNSNQEPIPLGSSVQILRTPGSDASILTQSVPYNL